MKSEVPETAPPNAKALRRIKRLSREDRQRLRTEGVRVTTDGESSVTVHEDMTDLQAQVISLKFGAGLSNAEIAAVMRRTEGAVKALQYSALQNLNKLMTLRGY